VIGPSFADIFFNNCFKNGILPVVLPQEQVDILVREASEARDPTFSVDLDKQEVRRPTGNEAFTFEVDPFRKHCLLNGLDDVGLTMQKAKRIGDFEARQRAAQPWLYRGVA
jgi:3-isopropylmalate/(R)-2-methylmalate dehydratase small subunit